MKQGKSDAGIKKILIVPRIEYGKGGGHFLRSAGLLRELRGMGMGAFLFVREDHWENPVMRQLNSITRVNPEWIVVSEPEKREWSLIILDNFRSSETDYRFWSALGPVLALDEGGARRDFFDFLIDLLPGLPGKSRANISSPSLLSLPRNCRPRFVGNPEKNQLRFLVAFGAQDSASMGLPLAESLAMVNSAAVDLINQNPLQEKGTIAPNITLRGLIPNLKEELHHYDLVLTHFGLTAFEAIYARVPVLIASPTDYHEKLARQTGFISLGTKKDALKKLESIKKSHPDFKNDFMPKLVESSRKISHEQGLNTENPQSLGRFIQALDCRAPKQCPVCRADAKDHPVLARFSRRSYRLCRDCSAVYMLRLNPPPVEYTENYFFDDYKKQYGKTYLEDFPHLAEIGKKRIARIKKIAGWKNRTGPRLLDIGCAYGPFLQAAREEGFDVTGIDPAEEAVRYVTGTLGIPACRGFFPDIDLPEEILKDGFDVISLWYVIEHFEDPYHALKTISRWLKPGGVLAFSSPSGTGISARRKMLSFLEKSPEDHWTIWPPGKTAGALKAHGFTVKKTVVTGHHPERFPGIQRNRGLLYTFIYGLSKCFKLGDTFEAYAVKI